MQLGPRVQPHWGRMSAAQMLLHCATFNALCLGEVRVSALVRLVARWLGPMFVRRLLARPVTSTPRGMATLPVLRAAEGDEPDFEAARAALLDTLRRVAALEGPQQHPLYGRVDAEDVRSLVRHHTTHHLNQFGLLDECQRAALANARAVAG